MRETIDALKGRPVLILKYSQNEHQKRYCQINEMELLEVMRLVGDWFLRTKLDTND